MTDTDRCQPVGPLVQCPEVRDQAHVIAHCQKGGGIVSHSGLPVVQIWRRYDGGSVKIGTGRGPARVGQEENSYERAEFEFELSGLGCC